VLTGGADPFNPPEQVEAFKKEMQAAAAKFEVISYPGVKHGFTNPDAAKYGMDALAYDARADKESWAEMLKLFTQVFG
jgi:dienelactone hydrolase